MSVSEKHVAMQTSNERDRIEAVADEIRRYLITHPQSCDTLEGIADWWIAQQRLYEAYEVVGKALELLVEKGVVQINDTPDHGAIFSLSGKRSGEGK